MKFLLYILSPLIIILLIIIRIPGFEDWLKLYNKNAPYCIYGVLLLGSVYNYYLTIFSPYKKLNKMSKNRWKVFEEFASRLNAGYDNKYNFTFNVMIPKTRFFYRIEPSTKDGSKTKLSFVGKVFDVVWQSKNGGIHPDLKITTKQGICGMAYSKGISTSYWNIKSADLTLTNFRNYDFNFTIKQFELTSDLKIIASCPLIAIEDGSDHIKKQKIGVLNIECRTSGSETLLTGDSEACEIFYKRIAELGNVYLNLQL